MIVGGASVVLAALLGQVGSAEPDTAERLRIMRTIAHRVALQTDSPRERQTVERLEEPIYKFVDPARRHSDGAIWAWGRTGRPAALLTLATYRQGGVTERWLCELTSLAPTSLAGSAGDGFFWAPTGPGVETKAFANAPTPAGDERRRLRQMKDLTRRIKGYEVLSTPGQAGPERYALRLLAQPVHRYADPGAGLIDGAMFLMAYGANPEVAVLIEASQERSDAPAWRYGFARIAGAELHVDVDNREAWTRPAVGSPGARETYWFFSKPLDGGS